MTYANTIKAITLAAALTLPSLAIAQVGTAVEDNYLLQADLANTTEMTPTEICGPIDMSDAYYTLCMFYHGFTLPDTEV